MKSSIKVLVTALTLGVIASVSTLNAQDKKGGGQMTTEARIEALDKAVTLTADQKAKIKAIYDKVAAVPQEERRAKMTEARDAVRALLTAEQQAKFDAMPQPGKGGGKKKKDQ
jgi:Spy/CpxP family protein refolding chaperone